MNSTTRIALLSFFCGGLSFGVGSHFAAPFFAPAPPRPLADPPLLWQRKVEAFRALGRAGNLVFIGDSRIDEADWAEWLHRADVSNRGISGDNTKWLLRRLPDSIPNRVGVVVLQIGVNDLMRGDSPSEISARTDEIIRLLQRKAAKIVLTSVIAVDVSQIELNQNIGALNRQFQALARQKKLVYLDLNAVLAPRGALEARYSNDGLHLNGRGTQVFVSLVKSVI